MAASVHHQLKHTSNTHTSPPQYQYDKRNNNLSPLTSAPNIYKLTIKILIKYLGVSLDKKLSFDQHTTDIQKRDHKRLLANHELKGVHVASNSFCYCTIVSVNPYYWSVPPASSTCYMSLTEPNLHAFQTPLPK